MCRISDKDVRDKNALTDARQTIERRMEKFKECEKDMKVKNFSKLGLDRGQKQDPKVLALEERESWLKDTVQQLETKVRCHTMCFSRLLAHVLHRVQGLWQISGCRCTFNLRHVPRLRQPQCGLPGCVCL